MRFPDNRTIGQSFFDTISFFIIVTITLRSQLRLDRYALSNFILNVVPLTSSLYRAHYVARSFTHACSI